MQDLPDIDSLRTEDGNYPSFSDKEFARRHRAVRELLDERGLAGLVSYGSLGAHAEVQYLSNFAVAWEAVHIFPLEGDPVLLVQFNNHQPTARRTSNVEDVRRLGPDIAATVGPALAELGLDRARLGLAGRIPLQHHERLRGALTENDFIDVTHDLVGLRLTKSAEELAFIRRAAELSDAAILALAAEAEPGMTEHDLAAIIEAAYLPHGGKNLIHFVGVTQMSDPDLCVPAQQHGTRPLQPGDIVLTEISAQYHGYFGQTLRPLTVGADPTTEYERLFEVAVETYDRIAAVLRAGATAEDVRLAAAHIEDRGFLVNDDVVHGANGNWTPIIRTPSTEFGPTPSFEFVEDMTVVIQPNPVSADERMGVQVGDMVRVTATGVQSLHGLPNDFFRIG